MCKKRKNEDKFYKDKSRRCGFSSRCKICQRKASRGYNYPNRYRDPVKVKARLKLNDHFSRGKIIRQPCEVCGTNKKVEGHHEDYSKPLVVKWLCQKHHNEEHQKNKKLQKETNKAVAN